jgi:hypothetical protein
MRYCDAKNSRSDAFVTAVLTRNLAGIHREIQLIGEKVPEANFGDAVEIPVESQTNCACHSNDRTCAGIHQVHRLAVSALFTVGYDDSFP